MHTTVYWLAQFLGNFWTAPEWKMVIDAQKAGVPAIAVANPGSGPGTQGDRLSYEKGMGALRDAGVEVIYVVLG